MFGFDLTEIFVFATLGVMAVVFVFAGILSMLAVRKPEKKSKPRALIEAEDLYVQNFYSLSAIRAFTAVEVGLKETLGKELSAFELIDLGVKNKIMSDQLRNKAHSLRMLRNKLVHESDFKFTQQDAQNFLKFSQEILAQLNYEI